MKKTKIIALALCLVMALSLMAACGDKAAEVNVPAADVAASVNAAIGKADAMVAPAESWVKGYMKTEPSAFGDYAVMINAYGANVDEFGIFKAGENMGVSDVEKTVEAYLKLRLDSWMDEYMPEEKYKVEDAEFKTIGNYVMYCILSEADTEAAFAAFEEALK